MEVGRGQVRRRRARPRYPRRVQGARQSVADPPARGSEDMGNRCGRWAVAGLGLLVAGWFGGGSGEAASITFPGTSWTQASPTSVNVDPNTLNQAIALAKSRRGQGMVTRWGKLVGSWGDIHAKYRLSSATKAWSSLITGLAIDDGLFGQDSRAQAVYPGFVR